MKDNIRKLLDSSIPGDHIMGLALLTKEELLSMIHGREEDILFSHPYNINNVYLIIDNNYYFYRRSRDIGPILLKSQHNSEEEIRKGVNPPPFITDIKH